MQNSKFQRTDTVRHTNGTKYIILQTPHPLRRLESNGEPYYEYRKVMLTDEDAINWVRCQSEMEDGRFTLVEEDITAKNAAAAAEILDELSEDLPEGL